MNKDKKHKFTRIIRVGLQQSTYEKFKKKSRKDGFSMSGVARRAIIKYINE